jgi:protein dithiol oxidoreductase (disulfide-forming)
MPQNFDRSTREFLTTVSAGAIALVAAPVAGWAATPAKQAAPAPAAPAPAPAAPASRFTEGVEFRAVKPAQPTDVPGKIEVVEFFWYGCPHCFQFEPSLDEWASRLPADVAFRKVHVGLGPSWVPHQQMYYALDALGKATQPVNAAVFKAIHVERMSLDKPDKMADFVAKLGVDRKQFLDAYDSFAVKTKMRRAQALAEAYRLDGVPALEVNGRWYTAPSTAGGNAQVLQVLDYLIARERGAKK